MRMWYVDVPSSLPGQQRPTYPRWMSLSPLSVLVRYKSLSHSK
jgi:hypothetical protein